MSEILLLLEHRANRRLLAEALSPRHDIITPESDNALDGSFDLGVVDGVSLDRLWERVQARKRAEHPAFLPFLLVTARQDVGMATRHLWKSVDELIISPIEKIELQARVASLLEQRRLSLEFERALVHASPLAVIALNQDGFITEWNPAAERIFGWSESEAVGQSFILLTAEGRRDEARQLFESVRRGEVIADVERRGRKKDGSIIDVAISAASLRDAHGFVTKVVAFVSDISERKHAEEETRRRLAELEALNRISTALRTARTLDEMLPRLLDETLAVSGADSGAIWLYDVEQNKLLESVARGWFTKIVESPLAPTEGIGGYVFSTDQAYVSPDFSKDSRTRESVRAQAPAGWGGACVPIRAFETVIGVLFVSVKLPREIQPAEVHLLTSLAEIAGNAIQRMRLHEEVLQYAADLQEAYDSTIEGWSRALDLRDKETVGHTLRVTEMTLRLARAANMVEDELIHVRRGALLHDIGKMGVPDSILLKPDKLTEAEWETMRKHPTYAYELLSPIAYLRPALDIPYCHHEKWDGTGYPRGLKGEQIPFAARLFAIADVWDALRSDRPYRKGWSDQEAYEHIRSLAGTHFDPKAVELFFKVMSEAKQGAG